MGWWKASLVDGRKNGPVRITVCMRKEVIADNMSQVAGDEAWSVLYIRV